MKKILVSVVSFLVILIVVACNISSTPASSDPLPDANSIATTVAQTFVAMTQAAPPPALSTPTLPAPAVAPTITPSLTPATTGTPAPGSIRGNITYPYGSIPRLMIIAFDQDKPYLMWWSWYNGEGMSTYTMDSYIPPSHYQVVAYDKAGHAGGCTTIVEVKSNQVAVCDITSWGGSYPPNPNPIP